ncbi:circadian clock-controlled protein daywake-like [Musca autumnalis]|uniref:circadian clock-controlled protein daywake-like n=1 Tax=Musca autumnalis TaxID=221902 RepID=UPI003CEB134A
MKGFNSCCCLLLAISWGIFVTNISAFEWPFLKACIPGDELCLRKSVVSFFKTYPNGIPELNIPPLEPLNLGKINVKSQGSANFNLNMYMNDVKFHNYTNIECLSVKGITNPDDVSKPARLILVVRNPQLTIRTHCQLKGKLLIFTVEGEADLEVHMANTTTTIDVALEPYIKDNRTYLKATSFSAKQKTPNMKIFFKNSTLLNGDPVFADVFTDTINENWTLMRDEIQPYFEKAHEKVALNMVNMILPTIPTDQFFKDK